MARFAKGSSGNPGGRPATSAKYRKLLDERAPQLVERLVTLALAGDPAALRLCIERLIPATKARAALVPIKLDGGTLPEKGEQVLQALSAGTLTPDEAGSLLGALANQARLIETSELLARVEALEAEHSDLKSR